jgi:hypothetical protein
MNGEGFPRVYDPIEPMPWTGLGQDMHVVWHHAPSDQRVTLAIESEERPLHEFANFRNGEVAAAVPLIQCLVGRIDPMPEKCRQVPREPAPGGCRTA